MAAMGAGRVISASRPGRNGYHCGRSDARRLRDARRPRCRGEKPRLVEPLQQWCGRRSTPWRMRIRRVKLRRGATSRSPRCRHAVRAWMLTRSTRDREDTTWTLKRTGKFVVEQTRSPIGRPSTPAPDLGGSRSQQDRPPLVADRQCIDPGHGGQSGSPPPPPPTSSASSKASEEPSDETQRDSRTTKAPPRPGCGSAAGSARVRAKRRGRGSQGSESPNRGADQGLRGRSDAACIGACRKRGFHQSLPGSITTRSTSVEFRPLWMKASCKRVPSRSKRWSKPGCVRSPEMASRFWAAGELTASLVVRGRDGLEIGDRSDRSCGWFG